MADAVADAIAGKQHLLVEAGTGSARASPTSSRRSRRPPPTRTAASSSRRTPSACRSSCPQGHPVPAGGDAARVPAVLVKGRGNYLSLRRLRVAQQRAGSLLADAGAQSTSCIQIGRWSRQTTDGSRSRPAASSRCRPVWDAGPERQRQLPRPEVPDHADCFYFKARKQVFGAQPARRQPRPVLQRPRPAPAGRRAAARLPGGHLRRGPHARRRRRRSPRHSVSQGGVEYLLNKLLSPRSAQGHARHASATATRSTSSKRPGRRPSSSSPRVARQLAAEAAEPTRRPARASASRTSSPDALSRGAAQARQPRCTSVAQGPRATRRRSS